MFICGYIFLIFNRKSSIENGVLLNVNNLASMRCLP